MTEREQFEAWWATMNEAPYYEGVQRAVAWNAWQAARAQPAQAGHFRQALTDPENQPNQYGVEFFMHGPKFAFKVGSQQFTLDHEPSEPGDFEFMRDALIHAFSTFTPDGKTSQAGQVLTDDEFAPDAKLLELADKIDHEQNWRHSGIFQRDHLTQDQKDRVLAGVMLRRYADLMAPESWRLFPPKSVVSHSYRAATLETVVKMAERHGIVGENGGA